MIRVWSDRTEAGFLDVRGERGSAFAYHPRVPAQRAVSLTMPVRIESWDMAYGLAPIFEMNLPEGALRERLRLVFAKTTGSFSDFDLGPPEKHMIFKSWSRKLSQWAEKTHYLQNRRNYPIWGNFSNGPS